MTESGHGPTPGGAVVVGTIIGVALALLFVWLFTVMAGVALLPAGLVPLLLLGAWAIAVAVMYGAAPHAVDDH